MLPVELTQVDEALLRAVCGEYVLCQIELNVMFIPDTPAGAIDVTDAVGVARSPPEISV